MAVLGALAGFVPAAQAQYFGRNQVQYHSFAFQVLRTEHFDVYFYPSEREAAQLTARMAERWYGRLSRILDHELRGRQPLILYASQAQFQQTNAISGGIGEGTGGVTESFKRRIVMPIASSLAETDHVLGHELVHAFQYDITGTGRQAAGVAAMPLWFVEGMAEYLSVGPVDAQTAMWIRDASEHDRLPRVSQLADPRYFPYRFGHALWAYIGARWGDEVVGQMLRAGGRLRDPLLAVENVLGIHPDTLSAQWHAAIRAAMTPVAAQRRAAADVGSAVLTKGTTGGDLSVGPSLSPDGSRVLFLSERGLFSIEAFVADAATGRVSRRLTRTLTDEHVESLHFIYSAGSWHPDGRRVAIGATVRGRPAIQIVNADDGAVEREHRLGELDEVFNPAFAPDGNRVVFTGNAGGLTDLYLLDLAGGDVRRLTSDAFADLQPAWSPDGSTIAFVTDRFGTDLRQLTYGGTRLALLDVATGAIREAPAFGAGKHINPQWSPDGGSLFFIGDPDGVPNVYRVEVASGALYRVTNLKTGTSGITASSPALSVAAQARRLMVTVYRDGKHEVYRLDGDALTGESVTDAITAERHQVATLPPGTTASATSRVATYLADPRGLPAADSFPVLAYRPSFGLDYVAQPYLAAGVSQIGTYVGGGVSMYWSSMLGDRQLATMFQINGGLKDIGAEVAYINLSRRTDWGVVAGQVPYLRVFYDPPLDSAGLFVERNYLFRQTTRQLTGLMQYPFSRLQRFEFAAGAMHIGYDVEERTVCYDAVGNVQCRRDRSLPAPGSLTLGQVSAALVYDNSLFGGTGPIVGRRWRIELSPTFGSLNLLGALADYRHYLMPIRPLTIAARVLHTGRYGANSADSRLQPYFLGYQTLVRGYDYSSFSYAECGDTGCSGLENLIGDQGVLFGSQGLLVTNLEARLPLFGPLGVLTQRALPPVDLVLFSDWGVTWNEGQTPQPFGSSRRGVSSYGAALRVNLFGFLIGEIARVNPVDRPFKGWFFQLGFQPGF
jgi:Tol biopolymer transport system component